MTLKLGRSLALACALWAGGAPLAGAQNASPRHPFSAEDVFGLEFATDPQVSPDGRQIAYARRSYDIQTDRARLTLWLLDIASGDHRPLVTGPGSYGAPRWSPDGQRLAYTATEPGQTPELRVRYLPSGVNTTVAPLPEAARTPVWSPDGRQIAIVMLAPDAPRVLAPPHKKPEGAQWAPPARVFDRLQIHADGKDAVKPGVDHVFVAPADGGVLRDATPGKAHIREVQWLDQNTLVAGVIRGLDPDRFPEETDLERIDLATGAATRISARAGPESDVAISPDRRQIAFIGVDEHPALYRRPSLYLASIDGSGARDLLPGFDGDVSAARWSPDGRSIYVLAQIGGRTELTRVGVDGRREVIAKDVGFAIGGRPYGGGEFSVGGTREPVLAYTQIGWTRPGDVAVLQGGKSRTLTQLNADLFASIDFPEIEPLKVRDPVGEGEIDAWVIKPPGFRPGTSYPLIIEVHGGPNAMYGPGFATDFHRYAAEGYVVAFANLSGSTGYGAAFANRIDLDLPTRPFGEVMALADAVVAKGYADPKRLFMTGGSYGGQLTAYAVGKTDRFAAAAAASPVIDWTTIQLAADTPARVANEMMRGMAWEKRDQFWANSPLSGVGGVKTPTLLVVGEKDWRTPPHQAEQFYLALKLRGVDTALVTIPEASHSLSSRPSMINSKVDNIVAWFRAHDPKN